MPTGKTTNSAPATLTTLAVPITIGTQVWGKYNCDNVYRIDNSYFRSYPWNTGMMRDESAWVDSNSDGMLDGVTFSIAAGTTITASIIDTDVDGWTGSTRRQRIDVVSGTGAVGIYGWFTISPIPVLYKTVITYRASNAFSYYNGLSLLIGDSLVANTGDPVTKTSWWYSDAIYAAVNHTLGVKSTAAGRFVEYSHFSIERIGWDGMDVFYADCIAKGTSVAKATRACSLWRYYNDLSSNDSLYGKLYNYWAIKAIDDALAAAGSVWRVPIESEYATLIAAAESDGAKLKATGTDYWTTANGSNTTGFGARGGGKVNDAGTFSDIKDAVYFGILPEKDSDEFYAIKIADDDTISTVELDKRTGVSLRLVKRN